MDSKKDPKGEAMQRWLNEGDHGRHRRHVNPSGVRWADLSLSPLKPSAAAYIKAGQGSDGRGGCMQVEWNGG